MAHHHEWATAIIPACAALAGAGLVGWLAACRERAARRHAILREQLEKFYSPMVALRARIRAKSETRVRIHNAADEEWRRQVARDLGDNQLRELEDSTEPQLEKLIEEDARRLREELLPLYREMVDLFTRSMWLAEPSTRTQFALLVDHVEVFERFLAGTIPKGVAKYLDHREARLAPLYDDLQAHFDRLRGRSGGARPFRTTRKAGVEPLISWALAHGRGRCAHPRDVMAFKRSRVRLPSAPLCHWLRLVHS